MDCTTASLHGEPTIDSGDAVAEHDARLLCPYCAGSGSKPTPIRRHLRPVVRGK